MSSSFVSRKTTLPPFAVTSYDVTPTSKCVGAVFVGMFMALACAAICSEAPDLQACALECLIREMGMEANCLVCYAELAVEFRSCVTKPMITPEEIGTCISDYSWRSSACALRPPPCAHKAYTRLGVSVLPLRPFVSPSQSVVFQVKKASIGCRSRKNFVAKRGENHVKYLPRTGMHLKRDQTAYPRKRAEVNHGKCESEKGRNRDPDRRGRRSGAEPGHPCDHHPGHPGGVPGVWGSAMAGRVSSTWSGTRTRTTTITSGSLREEIVNKAGRTGGTFLHTSRTNPSNVKREAVPEHLEDAYTDEVNDLTPEVLKNLDFLGMDYLIPIGGDDTLSYGVRIYQEGVKVVGDAEDHGQRRAGHRLLHRVQHLRDPDHQMTNSLRTTAGSHERFMVLEVFGRYAGFTAMLPTMAGAANRCVIPEHKFDIDRLTELLVDDRYRNPSRYSVVLVSEGAMFEGGEMVFQETTSDSFGHKKLGGSATWFPRN